MCWDKFYKDNTREIILLNEDAYLQDYHVGDIIIHKDESWIITQITREWEGNDLSRYIYLMYNGTPIRE